MYFGLNFKIKRWVLLGGEVMKLGQEITFKNDFKIETLITNTKLQVKKGDKAIATRTGLKILSGEGRGKITSYQEGEHIRGYDHKNIAKMVFNRINCVYDIEGFMMYEDIKKSEIIDEIEDILTDIL